MRALIHPERRQAENSFMRTIAPFRSLLLLALGVPAFAQETAPATLPRIRFGLRGMGVAPAGVTTANTGHHHLLVDVDTLPPDNQPIPNDANHRHFGLGQTETELTLAPGQHTLQLVLGDALHIPHQPPVRSEKITITVSQ
jgi:hypothetical protein